MTPEADVTAVTETHLELKLSVEKHMKTLHSTSHVAGWNNKLLQFFTALQDVRTSSDFTSSWNCLTLLTNVCTQKGTRGNGNQITNKCSEQIGETIFTDL